MFEHYDVIIKQIDELISLLRSIQIEPEISSHLEYDYLIAYEFYNAYLANPAGNVPLKGFIAFGGLHELYKWIWAAKDSEEFHKLRSHLSLLVQSSPRINAFTPMINPVTGKQDDKTNKFIEAIVGFFAVAHGSNVELDDPIHSSGGNNPDVIFDFLGQRLSIACKTLRSNKPETILGNIESAAKQISSAKCDLGYILLNSMNILDHDKVNNTVFNSYQEPFNLLKAGLEDTYGRIIDNYGNKLYEIFNDNPKTCPYVVSTLHSATRLYSNIGILSTSLKGTTITNFNPKSAYLDCELQRFPRAFNLFIHNRKLDVD